MRAVAEARTNIALIKYWGKCDAALNLPAVPSLSLTLQGLSTRTAVHFDAAFERDRLWINDEATEGVPLSRVSRHLDLIAAQPGARILGARGRLAAEVRSWNSFPTAAGLASSASAFAALTVAAAALARLSLDERELSILARQGSGSAARSVLGGLVAMGAGTPSIRDSAYASQVAPESAWPELRLVIGVASEEPKDTPSTSGMNHTARTSPYYAPFLAAAPAEFTQAMDAISRRDLEALGEATERSALRMHACAMAAAPGVVYLVGATVEALHAMRALRRQGVMAWFTCDAGPHPKALTSAHDAGRVAQVLAGVAGVRRTLIAQPGAGARLLEEEA